MQKIKGKINMYQIMPAKEDEKEEILKLYKVQLGREFCPWDEVYPGADEIAFDLARDSLFVMKEETGRILAAVSIDEDKQVDALECWSKALQPGGELARLAVLPELQNKGIARKMLQYGMEVLKERGFHSIHFLVNEKNEKAIRSYAAFDFSVVGRCELYGQPFLCYEKEL